MAAIQGNKVWNNRGSSWDFSSHDDAWQAYGLICDYEAFLNDQVRSGQITINDPRPVKTEVKHHPFPELPSYSNTPMNLNDGHGGFGRTAQND